MAAMSDRDFAAAIERLGPFERRPLIAVAVSGGADSLALCLLAAAWAKARGGRVVALTIDHRLRPQSTREARQVGRWLNRRGIAHEVLTWKGPHPRGDIQAAARAARYALLEEWCRKSHCLHLLTAHHREDQAETFWLRLARGSGLDGLAAIAAIAERPDCRVLRPLLEVPSDRLRARLRAEDQPWLEDPSNRNPAYARVRLRRGRSLLAAEGLSAERLGLTVRQLGRARRALEQDLAVLLARAVRLDPLGFATLDRAALAEAEPEVALRALAALLTTVSGSSYPARRERLERLLSALQSGSVGRGRTLGGCRLVPGRLGRVLVCREAAAIARPRRLRGGTVEIWDGRYRIWLKKGAAAGITVSAVHTGTLPRAAQAALAALPPLARAALPALWHGGDFKALTSPPLSARRGCMARLQFRPSRALSPLAFTVV